MKTAAVERWLINQTLTEAILNVPVGLVCLVASLIALGLTTMVVWLASFILFQTVAGIITANFDYKLSDSTLFCEIICSAFLVWLFVSHFRRNAELFSQARYRTAKVHVSAAGLSQALNVLLAGPGREDGILARMLYTGPQWFASAISMFYKSVTLLQMDIGSCAKILVVLVQKGSRVSFTELAQLVPECNAVKIFPQLRDIVGVIFLQNEPCGISLTSDVRAELSRILGVKIKLEPQPKFDRQTYRQTKSAPPPRPPPRPIVEEEPPGPHKILGVSRSASLAQIKAAYRRQIKQCHPDRFATLNKDWQQMAEQRSKIVNAAYAALTAQFSKRTGVQ